eukprot:TRINITY_DN26621_c0_g1_i2.p1 TRINITY_DN26621_c0_g1~~TRINITY_DN26621_c0_g1_i2.p1  ORF type:complete len:159 (+),score=13.90 TRINITY_DN26621_c0_g1_i2:129-605(+)
MIRPPPTSTLSSSSAASDVYKRQDVLSPTLKAPAAPDLSLSYMHEAVSKASSFPSPWCLQFEPVVEGAFLVWRGKQQFYGLCLGAALQSIDRLNSNSLTRSPSALLWLPSTPTADCREASSHVEDFGSKAWREVFDGEQGPLLGTGTRALGRLICRGE